ncbi:flagellar biosynthesis protein FliO domain protein [Peptostreptococcaceae bacterium AS15]|nr:flagellar biosynthesis protein FliO domain protein [Peptostreptococcaceae bacterium AS15]
MILGLKKASIFVEKRNYNFYKDKNMKVLEKIVLSKDKEIFLVEVYGKKYFLGASNNNISVLKELDYKDDTDRK